MTEQARSERKMQNRVDRFRNKIIAASSVSANTTVDQNTLGALTLRRKKTCAPKLAMMLEPLTGRTRLV